MLFPNLPLSPHGKRESTGKRVLPCDGVRAPLNKTRFHPRHAAVRGIGLNGPLRWQELAPPTQLDQPLLFEHPHRDTCSMSSLRIAHCSDDALLLMTLIFWRDIIHRSGQLTVVSDRLLMQHRTSTQSHENHVRLMNQLLMQNLI